MGRLDSKLYNQEEFKKGTRTDRLTMHLVAGAKGNYPLTEAEQEYLGYVEDAWDLFKANRSVSIAVKLLRSQIKGLRQFPATQIMRDAQAIFTPFEEINRPAQRGMIREQYLLCIKQCEDAHNRCTEEGDKGMWMKLRGDYWDRLERIDQIATIEEAVVEQAALPEIDFTNDPAAMMETEEITYREA